MEALTAELDSSNRQLLKEKDTGKDLQGEVTKLRDTVKLGDLENDQLKKKNLAMEEEIIVLLQIESDKARQILMLEEN